MTPAAPPPDLLQHLLAASLDGILVIERGWTITYANPAACGILGREAADLLGRSVLELVAERERPRQLAQSLSNRPGHYDTVIVRPDGEERVIAYSTELLPAPQGDRSFAILRDVTAERSAERQARTLASLAARMTLAQPLEALLGELAREVCEGLGAEGALFLVPEGGARRLRASGSCCVGGRFVEAEAHLGLPAVFARAFERQQLELLAGARARLLADPGFAELEPLAAQTNWDALLCVPLSYRGAALGVMALFFAPGIPIDARRRAFAQAVGDQIALMLQSARLFARAEQRNAELTVLLETSREIALTLELRELLQQLLDNLRRVVDYDGAALFASAAEGELELLCYRGPLPQAELSWRWDLRQAAHNRAVLEGRAPVVIADVRAETPYAEAFRATAQAQLGYVPEAIGTWLGVPLLVRDRVIGLLAFDHRTPGYYTPERVALAQAFAQQAAVAVENAQLFEQARGRAALEERQRLARELHDSVSQALYGIALGARAALGAAKNNPAGLAEPLEYILGLSEAGLAEMRALIFELRPESLAEEGLVAALARQAAAAKARYELEVRTQLGAEPELSLERKEALYRIAQEAMHNAVKHAEASRLTLALEPCGEALVLTVADDGKGFDPSAEFPGHLGQRSMRERAEAIGARLNVTSQPGAGTRVRLELPL